jgi:hypothetical protein
VAEQMPQLAAVRGQTRGDIAWGLRGTDATISVDRSQEIRAESKAGCCPTSAPSRTSAASPDGA